MKEFSLLISRQWNSRTHDSCMHHSFNSDVMWYNMVRNAIKSFSCMILVLLFSSWWPHHKRQKWGMCALSSRADGTWNFLIKTYCWEKRDKKTWKILLPSFLSSPSALVPLISIFMMFRRVCSSESLVWSVFLINRNNDAEDDVLHNWGMGDVSSSY